MKDDPVAYGKGGGFENHIYWLLDHIRISEENQSMIDYKDLIMCIMKSYGSF